MVTQTILDFLAILYYNWLVEFMKNEKIYR